VDVNVVTFYKAKHRLRIYENRLLRRLIERNREEVIGGWEAFLIRSFIT
jgi:hypothetical protein